LIVRADFAEPEPAAAKVADAVTKRFDRLDLLLHNASVYTPDSLDDASADGLGHNFAVHALTPMLLTKRLRPLLEAAGGTVLAMTDTDLDRTRPGYLSYQISKAALATLVRNLARELAPIVTANLIAPGAILWPADATDEEKRTYLTRVPLDRPAEREDVPNLVEFLCTRGKYITGETIRVDGGRSLR
jgi:pteridine reductase